MDDQCDKLDDHLQLDTVQLGHVDGPGAAAAAAHRHRALLVRLAYHRVRTAVRRILRAQRSRQRSISQRSFPFSLLPRREFSQGRPQDFGWGGGSIIIIIIIKRQLISRRNMPEGIIRARRYIDT